MVLTFVLFSSTFTTIALDRSMDAFSEDIEAGFLVDRSGKISHDEQDIVRKWGFDALYANLGYRLLDADTHAVLYRSAAKNFQGAAIDAVPLDIPHGFSKRSNGIAAHRDTIHIDGTPYLLDLMRSDRIAELANEALLPAIVNFAYLSLLFTSAIFFAVALISIRLIVNRVSALSRKIESIQPDDLSARLSTDDLPNELVPIASSFNTALSRVENAFDQQQRFVANAAHELRTPLAVLLGRIELSMDHSALRDDLVADSHYLNRIVEQLLDLSRIQDTMSRRLGTVDLIPLVADSIARLAPLALDHGHEIEYSAQVPQSLIRADEGEIMITVKNLVENAIKHTPEGGQILVTVTDKFLAVEDSGSGIPKGLRKTVFERFWRAEQSKRTGSGLGLSICHEILTLHDAEIEIVDSAQLGGARFNIRFSA